MKFILDNASKLSRPPSPFFQGSIAKSLLLLLFHTSSRLQSLRHRPLHSNQQLFSDYDQRPHPPTLRDQHFFCFVFEAMFFGFLHLAFLALTDVVDLPGTLYFLNFLAGLQFSGSIFCYPKALGLYGQLAILDVFQLKNGASKYDQERSNLCDGFLSCATSILRLLRNLRHQYKRKNHLSSASTSFLIPTGEIYV